MVEKFEIGKKYRTWDGRVVTLMKNAHVNDE